MKNLAITLLILSFAATTMAQSNNAWTTQQNTFRSSASGNATNTLGLSNELSRSKRRGTYSSWFGRGYYSNGFSFGRRSSSDFSSSNGSSSGSFSAPRPFSFNGSSRGASAAHSTYTSNSGRSVNSLGLTTSISADNKRHFSTSAPGMSAPISQTTHRPTAEKYSAPPITARPVGDLATTSDAGESTGPYEEFNPGTFNDWTTDAMATPVGDAIIPLLILLSLFITCRKLKHCLLLL